jgi:hypothetical protein
MATIWLAHVKAYDTNLAAEVTLYFSSSMYVTGSTDLPPNGVANTYYEPRIKQPAIIEQNIFQSATTFGASQTGFGALELVNVDGGLDSIVDYGLDGRRITLILGERQQSDTATTWTVVLTGVIEQAEVDYNSVNLRLKDRQFELDTPISPNIYAGDNVLPDGVEGVEGDLKGKRKPKLYGTVYNISPPIVNTSKLIYQVNDGVIHDVPAVYDKGFSLTKGADYTDLADMLANDPASGHYRILKGGGYFRLGALPDGQITCDAIEGANAAARTVAQILKKIVLTKIDNSDINATDVSNLDAACSYEVGVWVAPESGETDSEESKVAKSGVACKQVMDEVCNSVGAWYGFDSLGVLQMAQFSLPSGAPVAYFETTDIVRIDKEVSNDAGRGIAAWKVILNYKKFYTVQSKTDLAGSVSEARAAELNNQYRTAVQSDSAVQVKHLMAPDIKFDTLLINEADAINEAARRLTLYKGERSMYNLRVIVDGAAAVALNLGDVIEVTMNRFGMQNGKLLRIIGWRPNLRLKLVDITAWG